MSVVEPPWAWSHVSATLRAYMKLHNLTASDAASRCGVDKRTIRRYTAKAGNPDARAMPYGAWVALRYWTEVAKMPPMPMRMRLAGGTRKRVDT